MCCCAPRACLRRYVRAAVFRISLCALCALCAMQRAISVSFALCGQSVSSAVQPHTAQPKWFEPLSLETRARVGTLLITLRDGATTLGATVYALSIVAVSLACLLTSVVYSVCVLCTCVCVCLCLSVSVAVSVCLCLCLFYM